MNNSKEMIQKINNTPDNTISELNSIESSLSNVSNNSRDFSYSNTSSSLTSTNVQTAIDEIEEKVIGTKPRLITVRNRLSTIIG